MANKNDFMMMVVMILTTMVVSMMANVRESSNCYSIIYKSCKEITVARRVPYKNDYTCVCT